MQSTATRRVSVENPESQSARPHGGRIRSGLVVVEAELEIPGDISIIGYDDIIADSATTRIAKSFTELGRAAVTLAFPSSTSTLAGAESESPVIDF